MSSLLLTYIGQTSDRTKIDDNNYRIRSQTLLTLNLTLTLTLTPILIQHLNRFKFPPDFLFKLSFIIHYYSFSFLFITIHYYSLLFIIIRQSLLLFQVLSLRLLIDFPTSSSYHYPQCLSSIQQEGRTHQKNV